MAEPTSSSPKRSNVWLTFGLLLLVSGPVAVSVILYQDTGFDPVPFPDDHSFGPSISVPERHDRVLGASERVGDGLVPGPEDLAYDANSGFLYAGCGDGWIKRVKLATEETPVVEDWVHVGGRPLGIAFGPDGSLAVADVHKGLMMVKPDKTVELLTDEAEGIKFQLTDGVDVSSDHIIYFTDAYSKFKQNMNMLDVFEGRPYGRLMSFDRSNNQTTVLLRDLYFPNGVSLSHDQQSLIFCETPLRRCMRYHIHGEKKGLIDKFIDNIPGFPDNIRYDGEGQYWIAVAMGRTLFWDMLLKHPFLRKLMVVLGNFVTFSQMRRNAGVLSVDLAGQPVALYFDPGLYLVTGGLKLGKHFYYVSLEKDYISRINLMEDMSCPK